MQSPLERMSPPEYKIWSRMLAYDEKYFSDMKFVPRQLNKFLRYLAQDETGKFVPVSDDLPGSHDSDLYEWSIKILKKPKYYGECDKRNKLIKVNGNLSKQEEKLVILHEIIHIYEYALWERYKQILCIYFFKKLSRKIGERKLFEFVHIDEFLYRIRRGYGHTVLFMLKSLDLDLRLHLPPGTIYAYERERYFGPNLDEEGKD